MALTVQQVVDRARSLMQDEQTPYRFTDPQLLNAINDAMLEALRLRPDLFVGVEYDPPAIVGLGDTVQIPSRYVNAIVYFVVGYLMLREDEFTSDARAATMLSAAKAALGFAGSAGGVSGA